MCVVLVSKDSLTSEIKMYYYYLDIGYRANYCIKTVQTIVLKRGSLTIVLKHG